MALHFSRHPPYATRHLSIYINLISLHLLTTRSARALPLRTRVCSPAAASSFWPSTNPPPLPTWKSPRFNGKTLLENERCPKISTQKTRFGKFLGQFCVKTGSNDTVLPNLHNKSANFPTFCKPSSYFEAYNWTHTSKMWRKVWLFVIKAVALPQDDWNNSRRNVNNVLSAVRNRQNRLSPDHKHDVYPACLSNKCG